MNTAAKDLPQSGWPISDTVIDVLKKISGSASNPPKSGA